MRDIKYTLPEYPLHTDMWDEIAASGKKIAVYGMGNGADKLFARLAEYGVAPCAVFASDGFVRGHSYRGFRVKSFSEVKAELGEDILVLVSFASGREEVIEAVRKIDASHRLYIPDMPVAGEEYFDKHFYNSHYSEITAAYNALSDEQSRRTFASLVNYKLFGKTEYLFASVHTEEELYSLLPSRINCAVDVGAYNGDTARRLIEYRPEVRRIYALEPDRRNFAKLSRYAGEAEPERILPLRCAAWSEDSLGSFSGSGNRNSSVSSTASYENEREEISLARIDTVIAEAPDYIKYDVEGAEREALIGTEGLICKHLPALLVSAYHRSEDIFSLVNYLKDSYPEYELYMRRTLCFPAWEIAIIARKAENK